MSPTLTLRLAVPHLQAGAIIGRQGSKIKEIREVCVCLCMYVCCVCV